MRSRKNTGPLAVVFVALISGLNVADAVAETRQRQAQSLSALWAKLDAAREYRAEFVLPDRTRKKSHRQLIVAYKSTTSVSKLNGVSPRTVFGSLITEFGDRTRDLAAGDEARFGVQEALNEYMAGELLVGNEDLVRALRARFPGVPRPDSQTQDQLFGNSITTLRDATAEAIDTLRDDPNALRAGGASGLRFPFWVANTPAPDPSNPNQNVVETLENEFHRLTALVYLLGWASNARAKREFFEGNQDQTGRDRAVASAKESAQWVYLNGIVLSAAQSPGAFQDNNGYELKRHVNDSQQLLEDIRAGFNPLKLVGDFVPPSEFGAQGLLLDARSAISAAQTSEGNVTDLERDVDMLETTLSTELQVLRTGYLAEVERISGIPTADLLNDMMYPLATAAGRAKVIAQAEANALASPPRGDLGQRLLEIQRAAIAAREVKLQLDQIPDRIRIEEQTTGEVNRINLSIAEELAALQLVEAIADAYVVCECSSASGIQRKPLAILAAAFRSDVTLLEAAEQAKISNTLSAQKVKDLVLQAAVLAVSLEGAAKSIEERKAAFEAERAALDRVLRNYAASNEVFLNAYFQNPAYRLQLDSEREKADEQFERAMEYAYSAAKGLEFAWADRVRNVVSPDPRAPGRPDVDLGFSGLLNAEGAFAVKSAGSKGSPPPTLDDFYRFLSAWDSRLRSNDYRTPEPSRAVVTWSLKRDILQFDSGDTGYDRVRFTDYIARRRVAGADPLKKDLLAEFAIQIGDGRLIPGAPLSQSSPRVPNVRIESIEVDLRPIPGRILNSGGTSNAAKVTLEMRETSFTRTFFAKVGDDDLRILDLPGARTGEVASKSAVLDAKINGLPASTAPNAVLVGLSPAASRWVLRIDPSVIGNRGLQLENLDDVIIKVNYGFGRPAPFLF